MAGSWTQEVPSFPPVPIDELYSASKKWAEKGEWKKQKDLAIKKAVSIVTCMVRYCTEDIKRASSRLFSKTGTPLVCIWCINCQYPGRAICLLLGRLTCMMNTAACWPDRRARVRSMWLHRTAACCLTRSLVWSWAMQSTSEMPEVICPLIYLLIGCHAPPKSPVLACQ